MYGTMNIKFSAYENYMLSTASGRCTGALQSLMANDEGGEERDLTVSAPTKPSIQQKSLLT
jgi:hypothetical protein